jgi:hypothetical protein
MHTKFMQFSTILITAGERNETNTTNSDSKNIATLLLLRNIQSDEQKLKGQPDKKQSTVQEGANGELLFTGKQNLCITEILDARTQTMIQSNPFLIAASDYMQTNEMASRVLSQV